MYSLWRKDVLNKEKRKAQIDRAFGSMWKQGEKGGGPNGPWNGPFAFWSLPFSQWPKKWKDKEFFLHQRFK